MRALALALCLAATRLSAAAPYPAPQAADKAAPAFLAKDAAGHVWTLADTKDQPVLLDFWATWCRPCLEAMPDLNAFYKAHQGRVGLLGLNLDVKGWAAAKPVVSKYALAYPVAVIDPALSKSFGAKGYPYLALVYQGKIVKTFVGGRRLKELEKELAPWL